MLRLPDFELQQPTSVEAAAAALAEHGSDAMLVAGGTDLYPKLKRGQFTPDVIVSLGEIDELGRIEADGAGVVIGGQTPVATVAADDRLRREYPAVVQAAEAVSTPTLRRMGTIGGNLCQDTRCRYYDRSRDWREAVGWCMKAPDPTGYSPDGAIDAEGEVSAPCRVAPGSPRCWAVFASDTAPALIAHGATVRLVGADGERTLPLAELYRDDGIAHLRTAPDEILAEVRLPAADGVVSEYRKFASRESFDFPEVGVAVAVRQAGDGTVDSASIVLTGVGSAPVVASEAAGALEGARPTDPVLEAVGEAVAGAIRPLDNTGVHPSHRKRVAAVNARRALESVTSGPG